jgi:hypothetical protein
MMGDCWQTIVGEDHVLSLNDYNTLKVSKYRDEIQEQFQSIAWSLLEHRIKEISLAKLAQSQLVSMQFQQIDWICSPSTGIDCEILFLGQETWHQGKLRIKVSIDFPLDSMTNTDNSTPIDEIFRDNIKEEPTNFPVRVILEFLPKISVKGTTETTLDSEIAPHLFSFKNE